MDIQHLLADIGLRAGAALFCTAIVNVSVDVAVLLAFRYRLGGNGTAALAAPEEAAKGLRVFVRFLPPASRFHSHLNSVKELFGNNRRVRSVMYLSGVFKIAIVEGVGKNTLCSVL
ncbi:MAG: hypothetical protein Q8P01_04500 [bacterium]|nr:hypothetical protein [bacterium]